MSSDDWAAVGSLGTAVAAVVAIVAVLVPLVVGRRQRDDARAAELRESIVSLRTAARRYIARTIDGEAVASAAGLTVEHVTDFLPDEPSADDVWSFLSDPNSALRASIHGFANSAPARLLDDSRDRMEQAGRELTGRLAIMTTTGRLIARIQEDSVSPGRFATILAAEVEPGHEEEHEVHRPHEALQHVATVLQEGSTSYIEARYETALRSLDALVERLSHSLTRLETPALLETARAQVSLADEARSYTADLLDDLDGLRRAGALTDADAARLATTVTDIEEQLGSRSSVNVSSAGATDDGIRTA